MSDRYSPRERWRWEEEREREDQGLESERRFARHAGDTRWGTGGVHVDRPVHRPRRGLGRAGGGEAMQYATIGPYAGLGPRGYRRSDERIYEDVCERLTEHGGIDATDIEVKVVEGEVALSGTVATRLQKHLAEDVAEGVPGVVEVTNGLRPHRSAAAPPPQGVTGGSRQAGS